MIKIPITQGKFAIIDDEDMKEKRVNYLKFNGLIK